MSVDDLLYDQSVIAGNDYDTSRFTSKTWQVQPDSNNNNYTNGSVTFDCSGIANSADYIDWSSGYIIIPVVLSVCVADSTGAAANNADGIDLALTSYVAGLKNGHHQLISSYTIQANGKTIHQAVPYSNMWISYKLNTTLSSSEVLKFGRSIGFALDSSQSQGYMSPTAPVGNVNGVAGSYNNINYSGTTQSLSAGPSSSFGYNKGLLTRQQWLSYQPNTALTSSNQIQLTGKNTYARSDGKTNLANYYITATIRLKDVSDYFKNVPLSKGTRYTFTFNLNQCSTTILLTNGTAAATKIGTSTNNFTVAVQNNPIGPCTTNPMMISSAAPNNGLGLIGDHATNTNIAALTNASTSFNIYMSLTVGSGVTGITTAAGGFSGVTLGNGLTQTISGTACSFGLAYTNCKLYVPSYTMDASSEQAYLESGRTKTLRYNELFGYVYSNIGAGSSFSIPISSGIIRPKELVVMQMLTSTTNGGNSNYNSLMSPFSSAGGTLDNLEGNFQNYNVIVGGKYLYAPSITYNYQMFMDEIASLGLNGSYVGGLTSGLINQDDWEGSYSYMVSNLAKCSSSDLNTPKSITIVGSNNNQVACDAYIFVSHEKECKLDVVSGELEMIV